MAPRNTDHGKGICKVCKKEKSLTANLRIRSHRIDGIPCDGGSDLPYDPAKDGAEPVPATAAAVDDDPFGDAEEPSADVDVPDVDTRPTLFEVKNARKVLESPDVPPEILDEAHRILAVYDVEGVKGSATVLPEMGQTDDPPADHVHVFRDSHEFEYGNDDHGQVRSVCACGAEEPTAPARPSHGGPNPHRAPLSRGHLTPVPDITPEPAVTDDVNAFMGTGSSPAAGLADVNDFMGSDEPEEENIPRWFPSRYDGNCGSCGADFGGGEEIRADGSGGWEARECCGDDAPERPVQERPKVVYPKPQVRNGRYHLPHPENGKRADWTRVTNFVKKASDHFALEQWGNRCLAVGLRNRPDLFRQVDGKDVKADRAFLNKLVEEAKQAAGSKDRARLGTIMHKHTEEVDAGHKDLADVPEKFRDDVSVYLAKMRACGLMMIPHLMERSTVVPDLEVAGTFDGIVRLPDGTYAVGDKKTGETLEYNQFEIAVQIALYAHGVNTSGIATAVPSNIEGEPPTWTWEKPRDEDGNVIKVRKDIGIVIHLPYGSGDCFIYSIPLDIGWEGAQLCKRVQESQKIKHIVTAIPEIQPSGIVAELEKATAGAGTVLDVFAEAGRGFETPTAANTGRSPVVVWTEKFAAVASKEEAQELYRQVRDEGASPKVLKVLVEVGKGALQELAKARAAGAKVSKPAPIGPKDQPWESLFAAVKDKAMAKGLYGKAKAAGLPSGRLVELAEIGRAALDKLQAPDEPPKLTWEDRFKAVTTKDQATELYYQARDEVSPERLKNLVDLGKLSLARNSVAGPVSPRQPLFQEPTELSWEDRFKAVTTKDQARELYAEARDQVATLGVNRLNALVKLGLKALSYQESPDL